jgi:formylglycine-generating enzyme required for sulfatase activity
MTQVFISYSRKDIAFVDHLAADLKKAGLDVWYDVSGIAGGDRWRSEIENGLRTSQFVLVVLSPDAITSEWVEREFLFSSNLKRKIIPLMYRSCELPLGYVNLNFIDVQGDNYARNFDVLLRALSVDPSAVNVLPGKVKEPSRRPKYQYIVLIGGGAIILAILLATPLIRKMFSPVLPEPSSISGVVPASTSPVISVPSSQTSEHGLIPTEILTSTDTPVISSASLLSDMTDASGVSMVLVSAGPFTMGSDRGDVDEVPVHSVYLDGFYIDKYEVTNALYKDCVNSNACYQPKDINYFSNSQYADHPVVFVDWNMAKTYCEWRGEKLPTEAQWEKAARGTDSRTYPWGEGIDCSKANYLDCSENTSSVTSHPDGASPYGVYDMAGNVWEWVADWYSATYYQVSPMENPSGPSEGTLKVVRGGAWNVDTVAVYSSVRNAKDPSIADNDIGFRCVTDLPSQ